MDFSGGFDSRTLLQVVSIKMQPEILHFGGGFLFVDLLF